MFCAADPDSWPGENWSEFNIRLSLQLFYLPIDFTNYSYNSFRYRHKNSQMWHKLIFIDCMSMKINLSMYIYFLTHIYYKCKTCISLTNPILKFPQQHESSLCSLYFLYSTISFHHSIMTK